MAKIIIPKAYITCLVTNDVCHAYDVIWVYKIHHGGGRVSYFTQSPILWLACALRGEFGARNI